jgi:HAD superfamily hydrolase (TIGR01509 family)
MGGKPLSVAWDVDGTLVDSEPLHLRALQVVCRDHGVDISDFGAEPFIGIAIDNVWSLIGGRFGAAMGHDEGKRREAFRRATEDQYQRGAAGLRAMPGAVEAVRWLAEMGVPMCAVSNSGASTVEANLKAIGLHELFSFAVTLDDVDNPKPHAEPYCRAVARFGVPAERVLAVEDSVSGQQSAQAAGLAVLRLVGVGAGNAVQILAAECLSDLRDFPAWWRGCFDRLERARAGTAGATLMWRSRV